MKSPNFLFSSHFKKSIDRLENSVIPFSAHMRQTHMNKEDSVVDSTTVYRKDLVDDPVCFLTLH